MQTNIGNFYRIYAIIIIISVVTMSCQKTELDQFVPYFRTLRNSITDFFRLKNSQHLWINNVTPLKGDMKNKQFYCDTNIPGPRSRIPPISVHKLRPGDIDIIGAIGDSISSGNGVTSKGFLELFAENKGVVFSIGGDNTWREHLTLPNILKVYNPNLYGYSLGYGVSFDRSSRFNVAEPMAMSRDMTFQADLLYKRMHFDRKVNMTHHWKLITIFIGHNDICGNMCYQTEPNRFIENHRSDLLHVLRFMRDKIPRLMVNYVPVVNLGELFNFKGIPPLCNVVQHIECSCFFRSQMTREQQMFYKDIMNKWLQVDYDVINRKEFHDKKDFTVILQPFSVNSMFPVTKDGRTDLRFLASDCFHFSARAHEESMLMNLIVGSKWQNHFGTTCYNLRGRKSTLGYLNEETSNVQQQISHILPLRETVL